jgi:hypothetical protein
MAHCETLRMIAPTLGHAAGRTPRGFSLLGRQPGLFIFILMIWQPAFLSMRQARAVMTYCPPCTC